MSEPRRTQGSGWWASQQHAFGEALRILRDDPLASVLAVGTMGIGFAAAFAAIAIFLALPGLPARMGAAPAVAIYLQADATDADAAAVEARLRAHAGVEAVRRIGRDAALRELSRVMGRDGIADTLPQNPLPDTVTATLRDTDLPGLERLRTEAQGWPKVDAALFDREAAQRLDATLRLARAGSLLACAVLGLLAIGASTAATLRWLPALRPAMRLARMLGGTPGQVLGPPIYAGALQAVAAVALAAAALAIAGWSLAGQVGAVFGTAPPGSPLADPFYLLSAGYIGFGAISSAILAEMASRKLAEQ